MREPTDATTLIRQAYAEGKGTFEAALDAICKEIDEHDLNVDDKVILEVAAKVAANIHADYQAAVTLSASENLRIGLERIAEALEGR